jgi:hypothetical protein
MVGREGTERRKFRVKINLRGVENFHALKPDLKIPSCD